MKNIKSWEENRVSLREENITSEPTGNSIMLAKELWEEYNSAILNNIEKTTSVNTSKK